MGNVTEITDHALRALARVLQQFRPETSGMSAILNALNVQTQELETSGMALLTERYIDTAVGAQLDQIGNVLLEFRQGESDADYTERLKAKIRVLRSSGSATDLILIYKLILPDNDIYFTQIGGGGFILSVGAIETSRIPTYLRFLHQAKSAGINGQLHVDDGDLSLAFTLMEGSTLSAQASASATSFTPVTPSAFATGDLLTLSPGATLGEQRVAGAITSTVAVAALTNTHPIGAAVERTALAGAFGTLTAQCTSGATTATFGGGHPFVNGQIIVFGLGTSLQETRTISGVTSTTITIPAVSNTHPNGSFVVAQPRKGLSDTANPTYGGQLSGILI